MESNKLKFFGVVAMQVGILLVMILYKFVILAGGTPVFLAIEPVDPRDPLRGDYMVFSFTDISTIGSYSFRQQSDYDYMGYSGTFEPKVGDTVYVELKGYSNRYSVYGVYPSKPEGKVFIKGAVKAVNKGEVDYYNSTEYEIAYGVENYFIPENTGSEINFQSSLVEAEVVVDDNGEAVLKSLYVDGKKWP